VLCVATAESANHGVLSVCSSSSSQWFIPHVKVGMATRNSEALDAAGAG